MPIKSYAPAKVSRVILEAPIPLATKMLGIHAKQYRGRMPFRSRKRCGNWWISSASDTRAVLAAEGLDPELVRRPACREVSEFVRAAFLRHSERE
jgi:hypothetical protein